MVVKEPHHDGAVIRAARNIGSASLTFTIADIIAIQDNFIHADRKESAE